MREFLVFLLLLAIWPGSLFIVGIIGESRLIPVDHHQSKTFWPGELALPVMALPLFLEFDRGFRIPEYGYYLIAGMFVAWLPIAIKLWRDDSTWYGPRANRGPTKIWHNLGGFVLAPVAVVPVAFIIVIERIRGNFDMSWVGFSIYVIAAAFYVYCMATEKKLERGDKDIGIRHPEDWQPIWRTRRLRKKDL